MGSGEPPLLRVHWPVRLAVADPDAAEMHLVGCRIDSAVPELVVTATAAASGGGGAAGAAVGTLQLRHSGDAAAVPSNAQPAFVLRPTRAPGGQLPILLHPDRPAVQDAAPGHRRRSARLQQQQPAGQPDVPDWQCQFIIHDSTHVLGSSSAWSGAQRPPAGRQRAATQLAARVLSAVLALLLLANREALIKAGSLGGSALAAFATRQLLWLMTAQPGGALCGKHAAGPAHANGG